MKPNTMLKYTLSALCGLLLVTGCDQKPATTTEAKPSGGEVAETIYTGGISSQSTTPRRPPRLSR